MAATFQHITSILEDLEAHWFKHCVTKTVSLPSLANGYLQFFSCENVTEASPKNKKYPVICAIGINYGQGKNHPVYPNVLPWRFTQNGDRSMVEDYSWPIMRKALDASLTEYFNCPKGWIKNGYASHDTLLTGLTGCSMTSATSLSASRIGKDEVKQRTKGGSVITPFEYILIATNLSPFLSQKCWTAHTPDHQNAALSLSAWDANEHLCDLISRLGDDIDLWVGHHTEEVWPRFHKKALKNWMLTPNLSPQPLNSGHIRKFWKKPAVISAAKVQYPYCPKTPSCILDESVDS